MKTIILCAMLCSCTGLSHIDTATHGPRSQEAVCAEECSPHDDAYLVYYALGMTFSGLAGASGTGGVLSATLADEPGADIALASAAAGSAIATVVFNWLAGEEADRYEECRVLCMDEGDAAGTTP